jgi:hypothetical protein
MLDNSGVGGIKPILHHLYHSTFYQNCKRIFGYYLKPCCSVSVYRFVGASALGNGSKQPAKPQFEEPSNKFSPSY